MCRLLLLPAATALAVWAQGLPHYDIYRAPSAIAVDGKLDEAAWRHAPAAGDFHFNWWTAGAREQTEVKLLWDKSNLYAGYFCHDRHISASVTERHGPVSRDDCVEIFISPNPEKIRNYYGFEINVIGTMLNFIRADWRQKPFYWEPEGVRYRTSHHGMPRKTESAQDGHWVLELAIPWKNFARDAAHTPPRDGDRWRLNLNRAGGITGAQYSTWSPVRTPKPNFHVPESFGWVRFVDRKPPARAAAAAVRTIAYEGSGEDFPNSERGFYIQRSYPNRAGKPGALTPEDLRAARANNMSLVRMLYSLRDFREAPLPGELLDRLNEDFARAREAGMKVIPRFSYSSAIGQPDASVERVLAHIGQLKPVLRAHSDVIALMEAGFAGAWGEWHSSTNGLFDDGQVNEKTRAILDRLLEALPAERMIVLRCPRFKTKFFGDRPLSAAEAFGGTPRARTGALNDCFLASPTDAGTFTERIAEEKAFLHRDNLYVPQGGETCAAGPAAQPFINCPHALKEMEHLRYSNLNSDYHRGVLAVWEAGGCMPEIRRRLGYRFRLLEARIPAAVKPGAALRMSFAVRNDGWASLHNPRPLELVLRNRKTAAVYRLPLATDPRRWTPGETSEVTAEGGIPAGLDPGAYDVLVWLPDAAAGLRNRPEYAIRMGNAGVWEPASGMNVLATLRLDPAAPGTAYRGTLWFK